MKVLLDAAHDVKTPLLLPCEFAAQANALVHQVLPGAAPILTHATDLAGDQKEGLFMWTITPKLMWQKQDRRIDEYAFLSSPLN
jgi:hypothetical protein